MKFKIFVIVRPGATEFIESMNEYYDIILWTASLREYADPVMDKIDPNRRAINRLFRESCTVISSGLTKDLSILDISLKDIIIIDVFGKRENKFFLILRTQKILLNCRLKMHSKYLIFSSTPMTKSYFD